MEAFIGLEYARGIYGKKNLSTDLLWNKLYGPANFKETMSWNEYREIKFLRLNIIDTRTERIIKGRFAHLRAIFELFAENCWKNYVPEFSLTVDQQLLPMKNRSPLIIFMPNKPDEFGMKF